MIAEQDVRPWSGSSGRRSAARRRPRPRSPRRWSARSRARRTAAARPPSRGRWYRPSCAPGATCRQSYRLKWQLHAFDSHCHYAYFGGYALSPHSPSHRPRHRGVGRRLRDRPLLLGRRRAGPRRGRVHRLHRRPRPRRRRRRLRLPVRAPQPPPPPARAPRRRRAAARRRGRHRRAGSPTARSTATAPPASSSRRTSCSAACSTRNSPARRITPGNSPPGGVVFAPRCPPRETFAFWSRRSGFHRSATASRSCRSRCWWSSAAGRAWRSPRCSSPCGARPPYWRGRPGSWRTPGRRGGC